MKLLELTENMARKVNINDVLSDSDWADAMDELELFCDIVNKHTKRKYVTRKLTSDDPAVITLGRGQDHRTKDPAITIYRSVHYKKERPQYHWFVVSLHDNGGNPRVRDVTFKTSKEAFANFMHILKATEDETE